MFKKFLTICVAVFLITLNAQAGSDGDLSLKNNNQKEVKDCFENLNRTIFALNQGLDKVIIKPIARGYRNLPDPIQRGTNNA